MKTKIKEWESELDSILIKIGRRIEAYDHYLSCNINEVTIDNWHNIML